jgi:hypothetical protein
VSDTTDPGTEVPGTPEATPTPPPAVETVAVPKRGQIPGWAALLVVIVCLAAVYFIYTKIPTKDDDPNRFKGKNAPNIGGQGAAPKSSSGGSSGGL